jgi:hypothetical protein
MIDQVGHQQFPQTSGILKVDAALPGWRTQDPDLGMPQTSESPHRKAEGVEVPTRHSDLFGAESEPRRTNRVFAYVLTSLKVVNGKIFQTGCGPNFQGDRLTLCTCMHRHRSWWKTWRGVWVAGLSDKSSGNWLFYLMQVGDEAASQYAMWTSSYWPNPNAKSAALDSFGDLYEPIPAASSNPFNPGFYQKPISSHVHMPNAWKEDICYPRLSITNQPKLLVGFPERSFLWSRTEYQYRCMSSPPYGNHPRFKVYQSLGDFYKQLI